jgi:hypothetical protein
MKNKLLYILVLIIVCFCTLIGCNKGEEKKEENKEEKPVPTFSYTIPDGQEYSQNQNKTYKEKTEYGETEFLYGRLSSVEDIKSGKPQIGDTVIIDGYRYIYNVILADRTTMLTSQMNGWSVVSDTYDRKTTEGIKDKVFGIPVKSLNYCFYASSNLNEVKDLPDTVESCVGTFEGCIGIKEIKTLPTSLVDARRMFAYCEGLSKSPQLPEKLEKTDEMFYYCIELEGEINIPKSINTYSNMFKNTRKGITLLGNKDLNEKIKDTIENITLK